MTTRHSLKILNQLREYDSFLDSLRTIADMGCGTGEDIAWWATLETRDDPPKPYNYHCFAVDRDATKLSRVPSLPNIKKIQKDFNQLCLPVKVDLMFSHDSLQYSHNPLATLKQWNEMMNVNAMLVLAIPQHSGVEYNKYYSRTYSGCFYHYTPTNLIYMLAVNGFDCRDAYMLKQFNDPWIYAAVYKTEQPPKDPATTSWLDLVGTGLLHSSIESSINQFGYLRQEDIVMPWLDRENYFVDYVSTWSEIPAEATHQTDGVFNISQQNLQNTIHQAPIVEKLTEIAKPIGVMRPPKKDFK
jgi:SAM-dependent methyltransferase